MEDTIRAVERGFDALTHLRRKGRDSPPRIAAALGLSRPTTYRILATLKDARLIDLDPEDGKVSLSTSARELGGGVTLQDRSVWVALPVLRELQKRVTWTSHLATLGIDAMIVRESTHLLNPFSIVTKAGRTTRQMLQSAVGRAYLSYCPEAEREALIERLRRTEARGLPKDYVAAVIDQTISDGYAREPIATIIPVGAIALPIRSGERVAACLDISWIYSAVRFEEAVEKFLPHLRWAQAEIEARLAGLDAELREAGGDRAELRPAGCGARHERR